MKINRIRVAGVGCLAAMTGLVTAASMVLTAPADAAKRAKPVTHAAVEAPPPIATAPNESGSCEADSTSVCSGFGNAENGSVSSGDSSAENGSVSSGCSEAEDHSVSSGGVCGPQAEENENAGKAAPKAAPAAAVSSNPTFAG